MKSILRRIIIYSVALFLVAQILDGVRIEGNLTVYIIGGIILSILFTIVKPILSIIMLPLNIITLGLFSFLINAIILYFLTILVPNISVTSFTLNGFSYLGFVVPELEVNTFFAFLVASALLSVIVGFLKWLIKK